MITVGSLFSGIGGIEYGLERTGGFKTIWNCEIDAYCSEVLKKHWPDVPNLGDITKVKWDEIERPDMLCGGFPCQDISIIGKGKGIREGKRSGLWKEYAKAICILRPRYVLVENVPEIVNKGLDLVLADLASAGYDAEWQTLLAWDFDAPHYRERLFLIAYPHSERCNDGNVDSAGGYILCHKVQECKKDKQERNEWQRWLSKNTPLPLKLPLGIPEPLICRDVYEVSCGLERVKALGNSVVPACAEAIGRWILEAEA